MKQFFYIVGVTFAVTLAVVIGIRLSSDAMAIVLGVVCAVLASVPSSLVLIWVLRQRDRQLEAQLGQMRQYGQYPPIVVVNGQGQEGMNGHPPSALTNGGTASLNGRNFKVIGQENTETNGDVLPPFWEDL